MGAHPTSSDVRLALGFAQFVSHCSKFLTWRDSFPVANLEPPSPWPALVPASMCIRRPPRPRSGSSCITTSLFSHVKFRYSQEGMQIIQCQVPSRTQPNQPQTRANGFKHNPGTLDSFVQNVQHRRNQTYPEIRRLTDGNSA